MSGQTVQVRRVEPIAVPRRVAAEMVGLSERELARAADVGELRVHYRGRKCLVDVADLRAWYEALPEISPDKH